MLDLAKFAIGDTVYFDDPATGTRVFGKVVDIYPTTASLSIPGWINSETVRIPIRTLHKETDTEKI